MSAPVEKRHRELAEISTGSGCRDDPDYEAIAQALADLEAATLAPIDQALADADWPNEGESTLDAVKSLLAARNLLARDLAEARGNQVGRQFHVAEPKP